MRRHRALLLAAVLAGCGDDIQRLLEARRHLQGLLAEAESVARADGCADVAQCRTVPVGHKPCGGPSTYLVYCSASTDEPELRRRITAFTVAQQEHTAKYGTGSDCNIVEPPHIDVDAEGNCVSICEAPDPMHVTACQPGYRCTFAGDACPARPPYKGICVKLPLCEEAREPAPVCGCDGKTYVSECDLVSTGVFKHSDGRCAR